MNCLHCKDTGIAIVTLDRTTDVGIQRCDTCKIITDQEAIKKVENLVKNLAHTIYMEKLFND